MVKYLGNFYGYHFPQKHTDNEREEAGTEEKMHPAVNDCACAIRTSGPVLVTVSVIGFQDFHVLYITSRNLYVNLVYR